MPLCTRHSARPTHFTHGRPALQRKPRSEAADNTPPVHTFDALRDSAVTIGKGDIKVESHAAGMHGPAMRKHQHTRFTPFPAEIGTAKTPKAIEKCAGPSHLARPSQRLDCPLHRMEVERAHIHRHHHTITPERHGSIVTHRSCSMNSGAPSSTPAIDHP